jgi:hypothetical protein
MTAVYRIPVPALERVALATLAETRGESEDATLVRIIRDAVRRELAREKKEKRVFTPRPTPAGAEVRP